jgi:hypothetical protein
MAPDDRSIFTPSEHRLDEAELPEAALERIELVVADPPGVVGVGPEDVDRDGVDDERLRFHAPHSEQNVRL